MAEFPPAGTEATPKIMGFRASILPQRSFDGGTSGAVPIYRPDRYRFFDDTSTSTPRIAQGAGMSYCAASFLGGGYTVSHLSFNRVLDFDGVSGDVEVEAGIDLASLYNFLASRGRYLRCHPGHGAITVGGCIAADAHGKNHIRDGTFIRQVVALELFHPSHGKLSLTPEVTPELFDLTCGGFGLTGHIMRARLRTQPLTSSVVLQSSRACFTFAEAMDLLHKVQDTSDYAYTWHDMSRPGEQFGAGFVHWGSLSADPPGAPPPVNSRSTLLPRLPGGGIINYHTTPVLAHVYREKTRRTMKRPHLSHYEAVFPVHGLESYFMLYGRRGFHEAQWLVPFDRIDDVVSHLDAAVRRDRLVIGLASTKLFGGDVRLLRYSGKGISLALNLPRSELSRRAMYDLDKLMLEIGGRPNLIKDGRLSASVVEASCPELDCFRRGLRNFDPARIFRSELSERLAL